MNHVADTAVNLRPSALDGQHEALLGALAHGGAAVLVKDLSTGRYEFANGVAVALWPHLPSLVGASDAELFDPVQAVALRAADQQALALPQGCAAEHRLELRGERREYLVWRQALRDGQGRALQVLSAWQDVTEARRRESRYQAALEQLEQQQRSNDQLRREMQDNQVRDGSTGLYRRAHFEEQLRREADLSSREQREFALVAISLDGLDDIRQQYGADACERVTESLGSLLRASTRAMDSPCRLGGERFVILLSGVGLATAHARMEQLRKTCARHIVAYNGQQIPITVSMGVASFPHTAGAVDDLMRAADRALVQSREKGGNAISLASIQLVPTN